MTIDTKYNLDDIVTVVSNGIQAQVAEIYYRKTINGPAVLYKVFATVITEDIGPCSHAVLPETDLAEYIPLPKCAVDAGMTPAEFDDKAKSVAQEMKETLCEA